MPVATINFPTTLPGVQMTNYGFKPGNSMIRTEMDTGLARQRRRYVASPTEFMVSWDFDMKQLGIFEKFYQNDCQAGSAWFNINLVNGVGQTSYVARFVEPYNAQTTGREFLWNVKAKLEVIGRPLPV